MQIECGYYYCNLGGAAKSVADPRNCLNCHFTKMRRKHVPKKNPSPKKVSKKGKKALPCEPVEATDILKGIKPKDAAAMARSLALELMEARKEIAKAKKKNGTSNLGGDDGDSSDTHVDEVPDEEEEEEEEEVPEVEATTKIKSSKITHSKLAGRGLKAKKRLHVDSDDEEYAAWKKAKASNTVAEVTPILRESPDCIAK